MSEYSFITEEGEDHASVRIESGRFKGVVYNYGRVSLPQEADLNENGTMPFSFEYNILNNASIPQEEFDEEFFDIIGDILDDDVIQVKFARIQNNSESRQIKIRGIQFDF